MEVNESSYRIPTPNVARMAKAGLKFARGYSGQVCAPSRTMLMTGKHLGHTTIRGNDGAYTPLLQTDVTVAKALSQAGYHTGIVRARRPPTCAKTPRRRDPRSSSQVGKWGLGNFGTTGYPLAQGFDYYVGQDTRKSHSCWWRTPR